MLTRRTFFKGLAVAAGLTVVAPKLLLPADPEYQAWVDRGKPRSWLGTGELEKLSASVPRIDPNWRAYLLSRTHLGCVVLYYEMLGIPKHLWGSVAPNVRAAGYEYRPRIEKPSAEFFKGRSTLAPREYFHEHEDGTASYDFNQWQLDHPRHQRGDAGALSKERYAEFDRLEAEWRRKAADVVYEDLLAPSAALAFAEERARDTVTVTADDEPVEDERVHGWWKDTMQRRVQQRDARDLWKPLQRS